jgi:hypothetical protein
MISYTRVLLEGAHQEMLFHFYQTIPDKKTAYLKQISLQGKSHGHAASSAGCQSVSLDITHLVQGVSLFP